ncbi:DNA polymerase III subunit chi [Aliishimia ponticola]|uniref:DNA polymerase III subunit chi n=1 Tax=Aliishimia ponticola TaxID=2499833 RepID=A0A4S4NIB0_9RHOB|nr:DNA polymerase III subunit chi [Aliishimia ponticola]THH38447.1 DNA polymerase III subunit chi [Aliishimia ponticola]
MGAVFFYHLTQRPLEATLPVLLEKSLEQGWRVVLRGPNVEHLSKLDAQLWLGNEEAFLPHGLAGGPHDDFQPILLTTQKGQKADCVICIDGDAPTAEEVAQTQRACVLFDGHDPDAVQTARRHWKALTDAGCAAKYWSEESGRWEMKAESGG